MFQILLFLPIVNVAPILRHGEKIHNRFNLSVSGSSPLSASIWWVIQEMSILHESRKIVFIVSDGEPDSWESANAAIQEATHLGLELYGIGILDDAIERLLHSRSLVLSDLAELHHKLFKLLERAVKLN